MAQIYYEAIEKHRPDVLMHKTFYALMDFYKFLENYKKYLESPQSVKKLKWEKISRDSTEDIRHSISKNKPHNSYKTTKHNPQEDLKKEGVWIQLLELEDTENINTCMRQFLEENNEKVYEANSGNWEKVGSPPKDCPKCKNKNGKPKLTYQTKEHAEEIVKNSKNKLSIDECPDGYGWHLTKDLTDKIRFNKTNEIKIIGRDSDNEQLKLEREPQEDFLVLRPNTYQLQQQINAIQFLQNSPKAPHRSLLRLFEETSHAKWGNINKANKIDNDWYILKDEKRAGAKEQRDFVNIALNTPDFAFLEGPPGSGKTTVICELILQLVQQEKRVLLCASTHVAVDNVLERLMAEKNEYKDNILPIRIGDSTRISEKAEPYQLENFIRTERDRLLKKLNAIKNKSESQKEFLEQLKSDKKSITTMILEAANLVCGTTIGILQHPDIKEKETPSPQFDVMIIDEASKTTFQEFLVPALLAGKWILVGDPKQLSPYVDDEALDINISSCLEKEYKRNACIDVFQACQSTIQKQATSLICINNKEEIEFYRKQAEAKKVVIATGSCEIKDISYAPLVVGNKDFIEQNKEMLPVDIQHIRSKYLLSSVISRRINAFISLKYNRKPEPPAWGKQIAWRLTRIYEQRNNNQEKDKLHNEQRDNKQAKNKSTTREKLQEEINNLLPFEEKDSVYTKIDLVRRVALPSILESLQEGFERNIRQKKGSALSDGLPPEVLTKRRVLLTYQHRMHPDIADFPREFIYDGKALKTDDNMYEARENFYSSQYGKNRSIWVDVKGKVKKNTSNEEEAKILIEELKKFDAWAKKKPNEESRPWEVAVLSFYRGQERVLRNQLRKWTNRWNGFRYFKKEKYLNIQLCTVDGFQGQEADLVLLSFANNHKTSFLESPNRLNVAITRARYQLIIFGNRNAMKKSDGILGEFGKKPSYAKSL